jgi:hypothetical protein
MVKAMRTRTRSGVAFRVSVRPYGIRRWHISVQRRQGVTLPVVHTEVVDGLLPPRARMLALAAEIAEHGRIVPVPTPPRPRAEEPVTTLV